MGVQYQNIVELKHCNIIISYMQTCLKSFFENSEVKTDFIKNEYEVKYETPDQVSDDDVDDNKDSDYNEDSEDDEDNDSDEDFVGPSVSIPIKKKNLSVEVD